MSLLRRIFAEPELADAPPVLVDVGAAGGVPSVWRAIAPYSIGVGFEPDVREIAQLSSARSKFRSWIFCPSLAVPAEPPNGSCAIYLTRSPQCSSTLRPSAASLSDWAFADFFEVTEKKILPAATLGAALNAQGIDRVDWLKCDTQGLDLKLFLSLSAVQRARLLAVEFEPGLIDAYEGEDHLTGVLAAMAAEPFWLAGLEIGQTPRASAKMLAQHFGAKGVRWVRRLAPGAPAWANARFLRDIDKEEGLLNRREVLLSWVFANLMGQHGYALTVATRGATRFGARIFDDLVLASRRSLGWAMVRGLPAMISRVLRR